MTIYRLTIPSLRLVEYFDREADAHATYHIAFRHHMASAKPPFMVERVDVRSEPRLL